MADFPDCSECNDECASCASVKKQLVADKHTHIAREVRESQRVEDLRTDLARLRAQIESLRPLVEKYREVQRANADADPWDDGANFRWEKAASQICLAALALFPTDGGG